ncbi:MAG: cation diffusion facilitator family transporter [Acidobacteria bacterium]|nr:cation diffusion facilitator family transporter [Acidobacteriota bacterium]NIM61577.1 cation diffusion facilitator family transporter [Acidobacteriota bacterium]NIO58141.1 cation diffusion facilitator family transporter [Acidobacteriota bacterium]NIQ29157.1 cation diffusion facilitator family transporter [Acidobacteriota bacterium]NIQ85069.1 cation diffusion facilitator family transporter [Acidobacteriota bacterium]
MASRDAIDQRLLHGVRATVQTVIISTLLALIKVASGIVGHSYALIADGIESMLDVVSSLVVWGGLRIARQPPDRSHPYGHGKAESLAAVVVALVLLGAAVGLAAQSVREIVTPHHAPAPFTLGVLVGVVAVKEWLFRRLTRVSRETSSTSLRVDAWHHRSDALTSVAAFIGISVALIMGEGYEAADDWAALLACGIIAWNGTRLLKTSINEVMDVAAPDNLLERIRAAAQDVDGVVAIEKCFARKSGPGWLVDIHVQVDGRLPVVEGHAIGHRVKRELRDSGLGILDVLVHLEPDVDPEIVGRCGHDAEPSGAADDAKSGPA